jgi:glycosyltransferase involved in cell wall biosynthesis
MTVSVVITSYNQKEYLREAVESVLNQTRAPDEIIITDDGSNDGSVELIRSYEKQYPELIKTIFHDNNVGIPENKNSGFKEASGDWVTYLDGDDRFLPNKIEVDLATLEAHPEADIVYANCQYIDETGKVNGIWAESEEEVPAGEVYVDVLARTFPRNSLFRNEMIRRPVLKKSGYMDPQFSMYHDWELRVRLTERSSVAYNSTVTSEYRQHRNSVSASSARHHLDECIRLYEKHRPTIQNLPIEDRAFVNRHIRQWIGSIAWNAANTALERGCKSSACTHLAKAMRYHPGAFNWKTALKMVIPYSLLRKV